MYSIWELFSFDEVDKIPKLYTAISHIFSDDDFFGDSLLSSPFPLSFSNFLSGFAAGVSVLGFGVWDPLG